MPGASSSNAFCTATYFLVNSSGNVGIGTTSPWRKLSIVDGTASTPQVAISFDNTNTAQIRADSVGDVHLGGSGSDAFLNNDNLWVCTGGSITTAGCPSGTPTGQGNLIVENRFGIGTTTLGTSNAAISRLVIP